MKLFRQLFHRRSLALAVAVVVSSPAYAYDPAAGDFSKRPGNVVRVLTYNVHNSFIYLPEDDAKFQRIIKAANPDVIGFQEIDATLSANQISTRLNSYFPNTNWRVYLGKADGSVDGVSNRNVIASRYPISLTRQDTNPASSLRGVCTALIDLPNGAFSKDLYMMVVHFKAGNEVSDHESRQKHADAITNWMRDARTAGGSVNLPAGTPMMLTGDTNLTEAGEIAPYHASQTMLDGSIYDTAKYGASSLPDWDGTENSDAAPYDYNTGLPWTHSSSTPAGRIDRFYFTDSVIHNVGGFVLNPLTMTAAARAAAGGLLSTDCKGASDHLPIVCDFALGPDPNPPGQLVINEYCANDIGTDDKTFLELKNVGGREINLKAPVDYYIKESDPLPATKPTPENEQYAYDLLGVVPPEGLFVLYSGGTGHSAGIQSLIESRLPELQRQNLSSFVLDNDNDSAIALVEQKKSRRNVTFETLVEAYGWGATDPATTRYFRLDSGNNLLVTLRPEQWTDFLSGGAASDNTVSRNPGNTVLNSYADWTIGGPSTVALENSPASVVADWTIY